MRYKKIMILTIILTCLLAVSAVSATNNADTIAINGTDNELVVESHSNDNLRMSEEQDDILGNGEDTILSSDYSELKDKIDNTPSGGDLTLEKNYNLGDRGLSITKPITIDGLGHMLNSSITVSSSDVILKNIVFSNIVKGSSLIVWKGANGVIDNCTFLNNNIHGDWNDHSGNYVYQYFINWNGENGLITNSNFTDNYGDCAIYLSKSNIQVNNCYFRNNKDMHCVKTVYGIEGCSISDCIFDKNRRINGVIFNYADKMIIKNCIFTNNVGNAIYLNDPFYRQSSQGIYGANCRIVGCIFVNNSIIKSDEYKAVILVKSKSCAIKDSILLNTEDVGEYFIVPWNTAVDANYNWWGNTLKNISVKPNVVDTVHVEHLLFLNDTYYINYLKNSVDRNIKTSFYYFYINEYYDQIIRKYDSSYLPNAILNKNSFDANTINYIILEFGKGEKNATTLSISNTNILFDSNESLIITLLNNNKKPLLGLPILITLGQSNFVLNTNNYGQVYVQTNGLQSGSYDLNINFMGSIDYIKSNIVSKLNINKIPTILVSNDITASGVTTVYNGGKYIFATLKDSDGNPIKDVKVTVTFSNGKTDTQTTNKYGEVQFSTNGLAPVKKYTATITFDGNAKYEKSTTTGSVKVYKATPKIIAKAQKFKRSDKKKQYTIRLLTNQNIKMKYTKVYIKVNGKLYSAQTNKKGYATFKLTKLTNKGKYKAKIMYGGNSYYNALAIKVKLTVK
ncbi:MAG: right-handed parallel beta-helix repeat-containing protein [Methanobrevibacter sp.]|nr:right-handed parallel beta-helix repeat-containing protein [Methanobrevibacter sp.]